LVKPANKLKKSMTKFNIALLLFTIILSSNAATAQELLKNNSENIEIKNDTLIKDVIVNDTIIPTKTNNILLRTPITNLAELPLKGFKNLKKKP